MKLDDILYYGYYDEYGNYIVVLDTDKLKKLFNSDKIVLFPEKD